MTNTKKEENLYIKTGNNVKRVLEYYGITQTELCSRLVSRRHSKEGETINVSEKTISQIVNGKAKLQPEMAEKILAAIPNCRFRLPWLLGYDDYETEGAAFDSMREKLTESSIQRDNVYKLTASIMQKYGVEWSGDWTAYLQTDIEGDILYDGKVKCKYVPSSNATVKYKDVEFETWELAAIVDEAVDFLKFRLEHAADTKRKAKLDICERQPVSVAFKK